MTSTGSRDISRKLALYALYIYDMGVSGLSELKRFEWYDEMVRFDDEDGLLEPLFDDQKQFIYNFANELVMGVVANGERIDEAIKKYLVNWDFSRLHLIDKAILRLAVYSLIYRFDIPSEVTIFEANELASAFSEEKSYRYINGILHSVKTEFRHNTAVPPKKLTLKKKSRKGGAGEEK